MQYGGMAGGGGGYGNSAIGGAMYAGAAVGGAAFRTYSPCDCERSYPCWYNADANNAFMPNVKMNASLDPTWCLLRKTHVATVAEHIYRNETTRLTPDFWV